MGSLLIPALCVPIVCCVFQSARRKSPPAHALGLISCLTRSPNLSSLVMYSVDEAKNH